MQLPRTLTLLLALTPIACEEALDDDVTVRAHPQGDALPGLDWAAARASTGGVLAWLESEGCLRSLQLDAQGAEVPASRRLICEVDLPALDAAVSDPARRQTLLLGRRGAHAVVVALADDGPAPPTPLEVDVETSAPLRGVVRADTLFIAALTPSRGVLERGTPRGLLVPVDLPPRARPNVEDALPEEGRALEAEVEAPGATAVEVAHTGESVALLLQSPERAWAWVWSAWDPRMAAPVALPGRALNARMTADADGLWWVVARGPKADAARWPQGHRHVDLIASEVEVAPRPEGGVWAVWRDAQGDVFARDHTSQGDEVDAPGCVVGPIEALSGSRGKLAVVALRGGALACARVGGGAPTCVRVEAPCSG
jgi:hypothetical protein